MKLTREGQVFYPAEPCDGLEEKILLMQAGGLPDSEEKQLMSHIENCGACKTLYRHYELIDENIRDHLAGQQNKPPQAMPKKLRIMLSEASKQHFASRLQELGHSILFQKPEVCDLIRPWTPPQPLDRSVKMLNNSCNSLLKDPFIEEVGIKPDFVEDCQRYLGSLVENPERLMDAESAKETFDRCCAVDPEQIYAIKSKADYFSFKSEFPSAENEYLRLLKLKLNPVQMQLSTINYSTTLINCHKYSEAMQSLNSFDETNPFIMLYFMKFKCFYLQNLIEPAVQYLIKINELFEEVKIKRKPVSLLPEESISLVSKWFLRNSLGIKRFAGDHQGVLRITRKITERVVN